MPLPKNILNTATIVRKSTEQADGCWIWNGTPTQRVSGEGYGRLRVDGVHWYAHRASWTAHFGDIPANLYVCHHCDVPLCVNPKHLFLGTAEDNQRDCIKKGRKQAKFGEEHWTAANTGLTAKDIVDIRKNHSPQSYIARKYNIAQATVSSIKLRKTWKHVQ